MLLMGLGLFAVHPLPAAADDWDNGQKIYQVHCAGCHGEDGVSPMQQVPSLVRYGLFGQPGQDLADVIRSGRDVMPAYLGILDDREILDVLSYLRTLH